MDVLPYHRAGAEKYRRLQRPYGLAELQPPSDEQVEQAAEILRESGIPIQIGG